MGLVYHTVYVFTFQLLLLLTAPSHRGLARLNWPGWLVTYRNGSPTCWHTCVTYSIFIYAIPHRIKLTRANSTWPYLRDLKLRYIKVTPY